MSEPVTLKCSAPECAEQFTAGFPNGFGARALTRVQARRAGWGFCLLAAELCPVDLCPTHRTKEQP